jgi:putative membrane protein
MIETIKLFGIGVVIGIANVIPGVSGGTLAVSFNVYDRLISVITPNVKKILSQWKFWLLLGVGVVAGILCFAKLVSWLFTAHPAPTRCFFIGIIVGSLPLIYSKTFDSKQPKTSVVIAAVITFCIMIFMALVRPEETGAAFTQVSPALFLFLILAGIAASVAMIIPGISGSFLLLALGAYQGILAAVSTVTDTLLKSGAYSGVGDFLARLRLPFLVLAPVVTGTVIGLFCGAALVRFLMKRFPRETYAAILGLIAGSIFVIFPRGENVNFPIITAAIVCFLGGGILSFCFSRQSDPIQGAKA